MGRFWTIFFPLGGTLPPAWSTKYCLNNSFKNRPVGLFGSSYTILNVFFLIDEAKNTIDLMEQFLPGKCINEFTKWYIHMGAGSCTYTPEDSEITKKLIKFTFQKMLTRTGCGEIGTNFGRDRVDLCRPTWVTTYISDAFGWPLPFSLSNYIHGTHISLTPAV